MRDFSDQLAEARKRLGRRRAVPARSTSCGLAARSLETEASRPDLWDDAELAKRSPASWPAVSDDLELLRRRLVGAARRRRDAPRAGPRESTTPARAEIEAALDVARPRASPSSSCAALFTGEHDEHDAHRASIQSGEGGADAQDWAEMLLPDVRRAGPSAAGFDVELEESSPPGSEAGISSVDVRREGPLRLRATCSAERGVHRLVRMARSTPRASARPRSPPLKVVPCSSRTSPDDRDRRVGHLRIDVFRSSGAGGQHVNVTSTRRCASPTCPPASSSSCQNERVQLQNKDQGHGRCSRPSWPSWSARAPGASSTPSAASSSSVGFGSQIRTYVMQPYQMVKDLRTEHEAGNVDGVLDGDLDAVHGGLPPAGAEPRTRDVAQLPRRHGAADAGLHREPGPSTGPCMIKLENVSKVYKGEVVGALHDASVEVQKGEFVFLVGPSGSGKSTFLRLRQPARRRPSTGRIFVGRQGHRRRCRRGRSRTCAATSAASSRTSSCCRTRPCTRTWPSPSR